MAHAGGSSEIRRFRVLDVLGRGGYGSIYRAKFAETGREITLRFLCDELDQDPRQIERLQRLHKILGKIHHAALPDPAELLRLEDRWVLCTEHIHGASLRELLETRTPIPASIAIQIVEAAARALHTLHSARDRQGRSLRLVHRGLRPSNLLLTPGGELKLLDFGLPRRGRDPLSGDQPYLSPEATGPEDGALDVYALSVVLAELLVGTPPGGAATGSTHSALFQQLDARLAEQDLPLGVRTLVREGIALDPGERPTARIFARVCRILRPGLEEHDLAAWAGDRITPLLKRRRLIEGELTGKLIGEGELGTQGATARRAPAEVETEVAPGAADHTVRSDTAHSGSGFLRSGPAEIEATFDEGEGEGAQPPAHSRGGLAPVIRDARGTPVSRTRASGDRRSLPPSSRAPGEGRRGPDPVSEQLPPPRRTKLQIDSAPPSETPTVQAPPPMLAPDFDPPPSEAPTMGLADSFEDGPVPLTPLHASLSEDTGDPETVIRHPLPFASDVATMEGAPDRDLLPHEGLGDRPFLQSAEDIGDPETVIRSAAEGPGGLGDRPFLRAAESTDDPETIIRDSPSFLQELQSDELGLSLPSTFGGDEGVDDPETLIRPASFINDADTQKFVPDDRDPELPDQASPATRRRWWAIVGTLSVVGVIAAAILGGLSMFVGGSAVFGGILISLLTETPESRCTSNVNIGRSFVQEVRLRPRRNAHRLLDDLEAECVAGRIGFSGTVFVIIELRNRGEDGILTDYEQHKVREVMRDWSE